MSDYETKMGTLVKELATKEEIIDKWLATNDLPSYYSLPEDIDEMFRDTFGGIYVESNGQVYSILNEKDLDYEDIYELTENPDGSFNYILKYYNGGCSFEEAIEIAFDNYKSKDKNVV